MPPVLNLRVGKSQHPETLPGQPFIPRDVLGTIFMLRPVSLNDQPVSEAEKIDDVSPDNHLATEFQPG